MQKSYTGIPINPFKIPMSIINWLIMRERTYEGPVPAGATGRREIATAATDWVKVPSIHPSKPTSAGVWGESATRGRPRIFVFSPYIVSFPYVSAIKYKDLFMRRDYSATRRIHNPLNSET